jgi:hypothetical protein
MALSGAPNGIAAKELKERKERPTADERRFTQIGATTPGALPRLRGRKGSPPQESLLRVTRSDDVSRPIARSSREKSA